MTAAALAEVLGGQLIGGAGKGGETIRFLSRLDDPESAGALTFCSGSDVPTWTRTLASGAAAVICTREAAAWLVANQCAKFLIAVDAPRLAFAQAARLMMVERHRPGAGIARTATLDPSVQIAAGVSVGPNAVIGENCSIGAGSWLGPAVVLGAATAIGPGCRVEAGAVLGGRGYGYVRDLDGILLDFPQLGRVIVGSDVDIGAHTSIDCGSLQDTVIGDGTKIDDLVYVAHNVTVGRHCLIMAGAILCGGCSIGDGVEISPGAIIRENVTVAAGARVGLGAVVTKDVSGNQLVAGVPARPFRSPRGGK